VSLGLLTNALLAPAAHAADDRAAFVTKLFMDVCIPNLGNPDGVRAWAVAQKLTPVTDQTGLDMFVGEVRTGATREAWAVPTTFGNFALSIRGLTRACAVWARTADSAEVSGYFKNILEGVRRPGLEVAVQSEKTDGQAHVLVYSVRANGASSGYLFTLLTGEGEGRPFQATIQAAVFQDPPLKTSLSPHAS
jgi:hypothetical protein